ncbi:MAG: LLM class flavin-dependent oxidoreductase [Dehalococcoidia bacterium]
MTTGNAIRFGLWYDFRNPPQWRRPNRDFYSQVLDQISWAQGLGYDSVWLTEHHFCEDGYTPSPLVLAGAIAVRSPGLFVGTNLMLLPLHDPVRLAEDAATLSILSRGLFALGLGLGYRELEFDAFKRSLKNRPSLMEEGIEIIRRAWRGEPVDFKGRRFQVPAVRVTPDVSDDPPLLLIGGMAEPAIHRAARLGDGFLSTQNAHHGMYINGLEQAGKDPAAGSIYAGQWIVVDKDPERTWDRIGQHAVYQLNEYISWGAFGPPEQVPRFTDAEQIKAAGAYQLWDADAAVRELVALVRGTPQIKDIHFFAQLPGEPVESGSHRVEYFARHVIPRVRAELSGPTKVGVASADG